jgi:hypothetical protein
MAHPTSVLEYEDILYISDQASGEILTFNVTTTRFIRTIYTGLPDVLEIMTFSNC